MCSGLWFDKQFGNLLKVDPFGNILACCHGFAFLRPYASRYSSLRHVASHTHTHPPTISLHYYVLISQDEIFTQ